MAFPEDMVLTRLRFTAGTTTPVEIQDTGFWSRVQGAAGVDFQWQEAVDGIATKVRDEWVTNMTSSLFSSSIKGLEVVSYHYDQAHQNVLHRGEAGFTGASTWAGAGGVQPLQCSVVLSLFGYDPSTYVPSRDRKRGRMYLPTLAGSNYDSDGRLTSTRQSDFLAAAVAWWQAMQGQIDTGLGGFNIQPVISSEVGQIATDVTYLRLGKVVDTQRRRRNKLAEDYLSSAVS